jgi:hypothetical protein
MNIQRYNHHHHDHHGARSVRRRRRSSKEKVVLLSAGTVCATMLMAFLVVVLQQPFLFSTLPLHRLMMTKTSNKNRSIITSSSLSSSLNQDKHQQQQEKYVYIASHAEQFLLDNPSVYGFNTTENQTSSACRLWRTGKNNPNPLLQQQLQAYTGYLKNYAAAVEAFEPIDDLRLHLRNTAAASDSNSPTSTNSHDFCKVVNLHVDGIQGYFSQQTPSNRSSTYSNGSRLLSYSNAAGYMEPLLPPMRHPSFCSTNDNGLNFGYLLDLSYLVHDFGALCRKLQPHSRIVLFDLGASLNFHLRGGSVQQEPMMQIIALFAKFGFPFDHIYAYEQKPTDPEIVFGQRLPVELLPAYHWINVGVVAEPGHRLNPFTTLLETFTEDDVVIVKLDIDTPYIEEPLARQLLSPDAKNGKRPLAKIIDHFYFEHHVYMEELSYNWGGSMQGSIQDSLQLFHNLRQAGVAAHFWI